jgi:hypothetical protein
MRARVYEEAIPRRDFSDGVCVEQRRQHFQLEKDFETYWRRLRPELDAILEKEPAKRPIRFGDAVAIAVRDEGVLWGVGEVLYGYISGKEPSEAEIKTFMNICPPFRAACYGLVMAWYNWSLRPHGGIPAAGRNDLMTAAYLPYCDQFITSDWAHRKDLREIAAAAEVECDILSFEEFVQRLSLVT